MKDIVTESRFLRVLGMSVAFAVASVQIQADESVSAAGTSAVQAVEKTAKNTSELKQKRRRRRIIVVQQAQPAAVVQQTASTKQAEAPSAVITHKLVEEMEARMFTESEPTEAYRKAVHDTYVRVANMLPVVNVEAENAVEGDITLRPDFKAEHFKNSPVVAGRMVTDNGALPVIGLKYQIVDKRTNTVCGAVKDKSDGSIIAGLYSSGSSAEWKQYFSRANAAEQKNCAYDWNSPFRDFGVSREMGTLDHEELTLVLIAKGAVARRTYILGGFYPFAYYYSMELPEYGKLQNILSGATKQPNLPSQGKALTAEEYVTNSIVSYTPAI